MHVNIRMTFAKNLILKIIMQYDVIKAINGYIYSNVKI